MVTRSRQHEQRFRELFNAYKPQLRRVLERRLAGNHGVDVDDVLQDVAMRLWRAICDERKIQHDASYIHRIASTALIDAVRRARVRAPVAADEDTVAQAPNPGPGPPETAEGDELSDRIEVGLSTLSSSRARAVRLYLHGYNTREIAGLCQWTEPKARNLLYRGLAELKQMLQGHGGD